MPALRKIVSDAAPEDYRFPSIVLGIVKSYPFLHRSVEVSEGLEAAVASR